MLKYFSLVLDLLEITSKAEYLLVAEEIEKNVNVNLNCYHRYWFLFMAFKDFLQKEISLEDFIQIWDVDSSKKIYSLKKMNSKEFLDWIINKTELIDKNSLYVIDELSWKLSESKIKGLKILHC